MGDQDVLYQEKFKEGIRLLQQQMPSKLQGAVSIATDIAERAAFDQMESAELDEMFGRNQDTPISKPDHSKRWIHTRDFNKAFLFDIEDDLRVLNNPVNAYTRTFMAAGNRKKDDLVIEAFDATATIGKNGSSTVAFPGGDFAIAAGGAGLTPDKIRDAREVLEEQDNMEDEGDNRWYFVSSPTGKKQLLANTEVTSSDFSTVKALVDGQINEWLGFTWIWTTRLPLSGTVRTSFAWVKSSMKLGIGGNPTTRVGERSDKNYATQVYRAEHFGATRMDEKGVVKIDIDESV